MVINQRKTPIAWSGKLVYRLFFDSVNANLDDYLKIEEALDVFIRNGISVDNFETIDQGEGCYYDNPDGPNCE